MKYTHYSLKGFPLARPGYVLFCGPWWKHYFNPMTYIRTVKYFLQRGWTGSAQCDFWDADGYLETIMIDLFKKLREHSHGFPAGLEEADETNGMEKWKAILSEIIDGLEAGKELKEESTIPPEVYPNTNHRFVPCEDNPMLSRLESDGPGFNKAAYDAWAAPLKKKQKRAALLIVKYWGCFWD